MFSSFFFVSENFCMHLHLFANIRLRPKCLQPTLSHDPEFENCISDIFRFGQCFVFLVFVLFCIFIISDIFRFGQCFLIFIFMLFNACVVFSKVSRICFLFIVVCGCCDLLDSVCLGRWHVSYRTKNVPWLLILFQCSEDFIWHPMMFWIRFPNVFDIYRLPPVSVLDRWHIKGAWLTSTVLQAARQISSSSRRLFVHLSTSPPSLGLFLSLTVFVLTVLSLLLGLYVWSSLSFFLCLLFFAPAFTLHSAILISSVVPSNVLSFPCPPLLLFLFRWWTLSRCSSWSAVLFGLSFMCSDSAQVALVLHILSELFGRKLAAKASVALACLASPLLALASFVFFHFTMDCAFCGDQGSDGETRLPTDTYCGTHSTIQQLLTQFSEWATSQVTSLDNSLSCTSCDLRVALASSDKFRRVVSLQSVISREQTLVFYVTGKNGSVKRFRPNYLNHPPRSWILAHVPGFKTPQRLKPNYRFWIFFISTLQRNRVLWCFMFSRSFYVLNVCQSHVSQMCL